MHKMLHFFGVFAKDLIDFFLIKFSLANENFFKFDMFWQVTPYLKNKIVNILLQNLCWSCPLRIILLRKYA